MADYRVIGQREFSEVLRDGRLGDVVEITFETDMGTVASVRVPREVYTFDTVRGLIEARVRELSAVDSLSGSVEIGE